MLPSEPSRSAIGLLKVLLAASVLVPAMLFAGAAWLGYVAAISGAERELLHASEVAREHAAKIFDGQNQVTDRVNDLVRGLDTASIIAAERSLHEAFAGIVARLPQVQSVLLAAKSGRPLVSAGTYPVPAEVDLRPRDYFQAVVEGHDGPYVSSLQFGDVNRQLFFGLARPWVAADGSLQGVVDVAVSPSFFEDFYGVLVREGPEGPQGKVITLIRDDGQILARYPPFAGLPPRAPLGGPFADAIRKEPESGVYESRSIIDADAPNRIFAYRRVQGYPVYVVAGRSRAVIVAAWRRTTAHLFLVGVPVTIMLFALTWTALVRTRSEQSALARARQEILRREQAEAALLRAQRLEAVGQMTGGVAHDFNNLLTVIMGSAEMLGRRADDPARVRRIADQIVLAARHGGTVTQQLLTFSRRQMVKPETIDLNRQITDFRQMLERAASEAVRLEFDLADDLYPVRLDPGHFEAAILNIIGNARDAMPQGGRVLIVTRNIDLGPADAADLPPGGYVRVSIADTGTGMGSRIAAKAFEPFFTTKEVGRGTGLGLSQVYGFAKQAGGDVRLHTAPGAGTIVELLLPRAAASGEDAASGRPPVALAAPDPAARGEIVLIVEDQQAVREMAVEILHEIGYATRVATTAREALALIAEDDGIDVLFSDVVMPGGMSGLQLIAEARRVRPGLKVLLTSGYPQQAGEARQDGVPMLGKPYDRTELAAALRATLNG